MEQKIISLYANITVLEQEEVFRHFFSKLSEERQEKLGRIKHLSGKCRSLGAWTLADRGFGMLLGQGISELDIVYGAQGKPQLVDARLHFNLSHSGDYALAVFAPVPIGCDIQKKEERKSAVARRFFTEQEQERLLHGEDFYQIWTKKESYVKLSGKGMSIDLTGFDVFDMERTLPDCRFAAKSIPEYELAVCYQYAEPLSVEWIPVDLESLTEVLP
jgi:4'-phosphopantetheinyl transferase